MVRGAEPKIMNAFEMMASFRKQAKRKGWSEEQIKKVMSDATSGDYNHLEEVIFAALSEIEK